MFFFFFNDTATTEIYTLPLHDALPISPRGARHGPPVVRGGTPATAARPCGQSPRRRRARRSEEHTSELQSRQYLVCRLLLEKKKNITGSLVTALFLTSSSHVYLSESCS